MTGKTIVRASGMSAKRFGKVATAGFIVSVCSLLWNFFKWMCIGSWLCIKWICIGTAKLCKWSFKGITKFTKWTFKIGKKATNNIKERRSITAEM